MAQFPGITLTNAGLSMIAESQASSTGLFFTNIKMGDGTLTTGEDVKVLTAVKSPKLAVSPESYINDGGGQVRLRFAVSNGTLTTGFFARELGIYAKIGETGTEQLYAYTNAGNLTDYIPDKNTPIDEQIIDIYLVVGNASSVSIVSDGSIIYVSKAEFDDHKTDTDAHADLLHLRKNNKVYVVGDCKRSPTLPSWAYLKCTVGGTTAAAEPAWPSVGQTVTDGEVTWIVQDLRQGTDIHNILKVIDVGGGVAGLPDIDGSLLTGVVVSGGTGVNRWIKFSDGTMIQRGYSGSSVGAGYGYGTFPLVFWDADYSINLTHIGSSPIIVSNFISEKNAAGFTYKCENSGGTSAAGWSFEYTAIGRWKA